MPCDQAVQSTLFVVMQRWQDVGELGPIHRCDKLFGYVSNFSLLLDAHSVHVSAYGFTRAGVHLSYGHTMLSAHACAYHAGGNDTLQSAMTEI